MFEVSIYLTPTQIPIKLTDVMQVTPVGNLIVVRYSSTLEVEYYNTNNIFKIVQRKVSQ